METQTKMKTSHQRLVDFYRPQFHPKQMLLRTERELMKLFHVAWRRESCHNPVPRIIACVQKSEIQIQNERKLA